MTTEKDLEELIRQIRLSTTAEQDERILADALAVIDQPAVSPLRTLARSLRRHWRLSTAAACVLVLLAFLPLALPRTPVEDSGRVGEVAAVIESPENPAPPTRGTEGLNTTHGARGSVGPHMIDAAGTRKVVRKRNTAPNARGVAAKPKNIDAAVALAGKSRHFGTQPPAAATQAPASRNTTLAIQAKQAAKPCYAGGGRVVDAETGEPVEHFAYQDGISTEYCEKGCPGGQFSISHSCVRGGKARVRILADGYLPEVAVVQTNKEGLLDAPLVVRLRRGKKIPGRVLDHEGKPVAGAKVVLRGDWPSCFLNGRIKHLGGERTTTDADGRFVATGGGDHVTHVIVFAPHLNIWSIPAPGNLGEPGDSRSEGLIIKLPQPATLRVLFDIPGAVDKREIHDKEPGGLLVPAGGNAQLKLKLLKMDGEGWKGVGDTRQWETVANPGEVVIDNLAPGVYDFYRQINIRSGRGIRTRFYGRREITLRPGETQVVRFVRDKGQRVTGQIQGLPEGSSDVLITVSPLSDPGKTGKREPADWVSCKRNGQFLTPLLAPGEYRIGAAAYAPPKPRGDASSRINPRGGIRMIPAPDYVGAVNVTIKESGPPKEVRIEMKHRSAGRKAMSSAGGRATSAAKPAKAAAEPTVEAAGAKPHDRTPAGEAAWGQAVDGVQLRLRCDRQRWQVDETIIWKIDVRNTGKRHLKFTPRAQETWQIEVDGRVFNLTPSLGTVCSYKLEPGQETTIDFGRWQLEDRPFQLGPGTHTVKITLTVFPAKGEKGGVLQVTSNPVEITIERALPGSGLSIDKAIEEEAPFAAVCEAVGRWIPASGAVAPGGARVGSQEVKVVEVLFGRAEPVDRIDIDFRLTGRPIGIHQRVIWIGHTRNMSFHGRLFGLKALPDTPQNRQAVKAAASRASTAWGEAVEGVQVRLRAKQSTWNKGAVPRLWADVRNQGKRTVIVTPQSNRWELEVDGQWYRGPIPGGGRMRPPPFPPGRQYDSIAVDLHRAWELPIPENTRPPWKTGLERLKLTPGKHTIRVAFAMVDAKKPGKLFKVVSNPIEIEIVAKTDKKVDATQTSSASRKATSAEPPAKPAAPKATPGRLAEERAKQLKADIESFHLDLSYYGKISEGREGPSNRLILLVNPATWKLPLPSDLWAVQITKKQAEKIVDHLATEGFLKGAKNGSNRGTISYRRPGYVLWVNTKRLKLYDSLGWDLKMLRRVEGLRKVLEGDAAKAMDKLLATLEPQRKLWEAAAGAASSSSSSGSGPEWGEAVDGVQVRLRAAKSRSNEGKTVRLWANVRNQGSRNLLVTPSVSSCELEVDGRWYRRPQNTRGIVMAPQPFPPGRHYSITVDVDAWWELKASQDAKRPRGVEPEKLKLTGGKHTIRVAFTAWAAKNAPGKPVRAVSNPVVIEVISAKEIAARPKRLKSQKNAFELRLAYHGARDNPNQSGVENPIRSLILRTTLVDYDLMHGWSAVQISQQQAAGIIDQLQVDGSLVDALPVTEEHPLPDLDGPAYSLTVKGPDNLVLYKPVGWGLAVLDFLERLRMVLDGEAFRAVDQMLAVLGPQRKEWEAAGTWGRAVEGVQVRLRADKPKWKAGAMPQFYADVRNLGTRTLLVYRAGRFWTSSELEIDGRWYRRALPKHNYRPPLSDLVPGRQFDNILVNLRPGWSAVDSPSQDAGETGVTLSGGRLRLAPGKHTIRVAPTMPLAGDRPGDHVRAISNPVEIEIVAKSDEKVGPTQENNADVTTAKPTVEATGAERDDQTTPVRPLSEAELDGKEILKKLKSIDAVYAAAFTASGRCPGRPIRKWKLTMLDGEIVYEEEVVEIPEPAEDKGGTKRSIPSGVRERGGIKRAEYRIGEGVAFRRTLYVGPKAQAEHDWVGRIQRYGPLDPWPENSPGPATAGCLTVVKPEAPTYMLLIKRPLLCLGRGYSKYVTDVKKVTKQEDGRLKASGDGIDIASRPGARWELVIDPDAAYMVRSAKMVDNKERRMSISNSGLKWYGSRCVPEKAECKGAFMGASFEIQSASPEADREFLRCAKADMRPPYLIHTDVHDERVTPGLYVPYDAGKTSPKGRRKDWDIGLEDAGEPETAAQTTDEAADATPEDQAPPEDPVSEAEPDGKEILKRLKSTDAVYADGFTASGKRPGWPRRKWKFTMLRGRIALEEEVVEIPKPTETTKRAHYGPTQKGRFIALRSTWYVGPTAQAKYDWVGRIPRYGPLDPWPKNSPGPATAGSLNVDDPDAPTYMLHIKRTLWCLGRGYSKYITKIREVSRQEDGRLEVAADGLDMAFRPGAKWELVIEPDSEYMVRSAKLVDNRNRRSSFTNSGLKRHGSHYVPEKGECKGGFISASFEFQSASFEADVEFLKRAKATMQPPYLIHTDVHDQRVTPERYIPYDAGEMSPQGRRPGFDFDREKETAFDMEEVPASGARKGEIKIGGRQYTALLSRVSTTTGSFDGPDTLLTLTPADNPKHRIQSYERHLGSIRTVDGKYYKISATPSGDKLTVTPCGDNVGVLRIGAGDRDVEKREVMGGILVSKEGMVPLGNFFYPVPARDPGQRRIPVGDYAPKILWVDFGNVKLSLRPNGPPAFNIKIRKDKPLTLNLSAKGNLVPTSPSPTRTFKPGRIVPLVAVIVDPELNLRMCAWDATQKVNKRTYTYGLGEKFTVASSSISLDPTVVIRDSSGKQVATGKMPFC